MAHSFNARVGIDKYPIIIGEDLFDELIAFCSTYSKDNIVVIADSYFKSSENFISSKSKLIAEFKHIYIEGGIESKGLKELERVLNYLIKYNISKDGLIIALGGGVVGDLAAFVSSIYLRGIDLVHVPTSSTAMIDSSVGGKTGLNYSEKVNLIGTYFNPKAIFMDLNFLKTLSDRDYKAGICEAIKMALTCDTCMFERLMKMSDNINSRDSQSLIDLVYWSVITKLKHVCDDQKEESIRLLLNYGHTFSQSIETYYGLHQDALRHGEAVALGITVAAKMSLLINSNKSTENLWYATNQILDKYFLPNRFNKINNYQVPTKSNLLLNLVNDKKRLHTGNRFILCEAIGSANVHVIKDQTLIIKAFSVLYE